MEIFRRLSKHYWVVLIFVVLISYGQILSMVPWQDDNALFFKLAHIAEPAGFLGKGMLGEGAYKYTAFFYYPIYLLFGYQNFYYYLLCLIIFFLSVLILYKISAKIIDEKYGKLVSILYACGYIASDGYIRLYNSVITSLSVIFISLLLYFYWLYSKKKNLKYYFLSILYFLFALEFARARTHYLIAVVFFIELIFITFNNKFKDWYGSIIRLLPFCFIFYEYFVKNADSRSNGVFIFIKSILKGDLKVLYGFFSSLTNLLIPSWFTINFHFFVFSIILTSIIYFLFKKVKNSHLILFCIPIFLIWYFVSKKIYMVPAINPSNYQLGLVYLGGVIFLLLFVIFFYISNKFKSFYLLFLFWILINLASYSAYSPNVIYDSINRYFAHSYFALILFLGILYKNFEKEKLPKFIMIFLLISFGFGNLINAFSYQRGLLFNRTKPILSFYRELKILLPTIDKGDLLYFDVANNARGYFADAFSVAQMPDTTAIAWRYGIDRYDFFMSENYEDFIQKVKDNNISFDKIYTFFYSKETGLTSTRDKFITLNEGVSITEPINSLQFNRQFDFKENYSCVLHPKITFGISAVPDKLNLMFDTSIFPVSISKAYLKNKDSFYNNSKVLVSSNWQERVQSNLIDQNPNTVWQADRTTWDKEKTFFGFYLGKEQNLERFIWINGFGNNTPISYSIEVSTDGNEWIEVATRDEIKRIDSSTPNEISFNPVKAKYVRMVINKTLNSDSAGISEAWVIPVGFNNYNVLELEKLIHSPEFSLLNGTDLVSVFWKSNSKDDWQVDYTTSLNLVTDGKLRYYNLTIPCSGTELKSIKFDNFQYPANVILHKIIINYYSIQ